jgi:deoxyribonuclease V
LRHKRLHSWKVTPREAVRIQESLRDMMTPVWDGREIKTLAAADVGFPDKATVLAAVVVTTYPEMGVLETRVVKRRCKFPYVPGLLAFREAPSLLAALERVDTAVDVLLCDAQGIAHRKRMGLAAHVGVLLDRPVVGCAKSVLYGTFDEPGMRRGAISFMRDAAGEVIGAAVRTRSGVRPVYVSVGHKIDLATAVNLVLGCCRKYRIPEPLRMAHNLSTGRRIVCG